MKYLQQIYTDIDGCLVYTLTSEAITEFSKDVFDEMYRIVSPKDLITKFRNDNLIIRCKHMNMKKSFVRDYIIPLDKIFLIKDYVSDEMWEDCIKDIIKRRKTFKEELDKIKKYIKPEVLDNVIFKYIDMNNIFEEFYIVMYDEEINHLVSLLSDDGKLKYELLYGGI